MNGMEYALARNPRFPDSSGIFSSTIEMDGTSGPFLTLSFRRSATVQSTTFTPEVVGTLGSAWLSGSGNVTQILPSVTNNDGTSTLKYRDTVPVSGAAQRHMRLRVTLP